MDDGYPETVASCTAKLSELDKSIEDLAERLSTTRQLRGSLLSHRLRLIAIKNIDERGPMHAKRLTIEEFSDSGTYVEDLGSSIGEETLSGRPGRAYPSGVYIEDADTWGPDDYSRWKDGRWYLILGRDEFLSDDLPMLEGKLYNWVYSLGEYSALGSRES